MSGFRFATWFLLSAAASAFNSSEISDIVAEHNEFRRIVNPKATNMLAMEWDADLAEVAQAYADTCTWSHNSQRSTQYGNKIGSSSVYVGENLGAGTSSSYSVSSAATAWDAEKKDYTLSTKTCKTGAVCGHYTQVVWAKSQKLGCGIKRCNNGLQGLSWSQGTIVVCNYYPGGNFNNEFPYVSGETCGDCRSQWNLGCYSGLCTNYTPATGSPGDSPGSSNEAATNRPLLLSLLLVSIAAAAAM